MRVLTVVATIFMPLTFITSIYGMNFTHMPELKWTYGYAGVWAALVVTALGLLYYFRSKKWF
jgi:magnesium transporter